MASECASGAAAERKEGNLTGGHNGDDIEEVMSTLPKMKSWQGGDARYIHYQGFWHVKMFLKGLIWAQQSFSARDSDIFLATTPKSGTNWGKALMCAIQNRNHHQSTSHPLLTNSPRDCVPYLELQAFKDDPVSHVESLPSPRVFATHSPYVSLPDSILKSPGARVACIARNPKDVLVSLWKFKIKLGEKRSSGQEPLSIEEAFELFCKGESSGGPYWDHVLGYWEASKQNPDKVLFLKYEEMKEDTVGCVKRLAEFMRLPFSIEEEERGVVQQVVDLCSFDNLSNLEVNKSGTYRFGGAGRRLNSLFFRKGEVGDSINYLTSDMIKRLDDITEQKLGTAGLKF